MHVDWAWTGLIQLAEPVQDYTTVACNNLTLFYRINYKNENNIYSILNVYVKFVNVALIININSNIYMDCISEMRKIKQGGRNVVGEDFHPATISQPGQPPPNA